MTYQMLDAGAYYRVSLTVTASHLEILTGTTSKVLLFSAVIF